MDAGLHAVAAHHEVKVVGRILDAGILPAVILFKGQCAVASLHRADDGNQAVHIAAEEALFGLALVGRVEQAQQIICSGVKDLGQLRHCGGVRRAFSALPLAHCLLGNAQKGCKFRLTHMLLLAALP